MLKNINVLYHSSIKFEKNKVIYFDPFKINENYNDADLIFITHDHYDHFSEEDIKKVAKPSTKIIVPKDLVQKAIELGFTLENIVAVMPENTYSVSQISFETVRAYNINKKFHPKENNWVGYVVTVENTKYYIAGDTDLTPENKEVKCDVAFLPVGGTYTMTWKEAVELANCIKPKIAIPIHYGGIVGTKEYAENFVKSLNKNIEGRILI